MLTDRYGLSLSSASAGARDAYVEGCDLALTFYPARRAFMTVPSQPTRVLPWLTAARPKC